MSIFFINAMQVMHSVLFYLFMHASIYLFWVKYCILLGKVNL